MRQTQTERNSFGAPVDAQIINRLPRVVQRSSVKRGTRGDSQMRRRLQKHQVDRISFETQSLWRSKSVHSRRDIAQILLLHLKLTLKSLKRLKQISVKLKFKNQKVSINSHGFVRHKYLIIIIIMTTNSSRPKDFMTIKISFPTCFSRNCSF